MQKTEIANLLKSKKYVTGHYVNSEGERFFHLWVWGEPMVRNATNLVRFNHYVDRYVFNRDSRDDDVYRIDAELVNIKRADPYEYTEKSWHLDEIKILPTVITAVGQMFKSECKKVITIKQKAADPFTYWGWWNYGRGKRYGRFKRNGICLDYPAIKLTEKLK